MEDKVEALRKQQRKQARREEQEARKREGQVKIDYLPGSKNKPTRGDYTDYVEVKD